MRIAVLCALPQELAGLGARPDVTIIPLGVGPVEAALGTTRALAHGAYDAVINAGIGGAFRDRGLRVGSALAIGEERYVELGREDGVPLTLPGDASLHDRVDANPALCAFARATLHRVGRGITSASITTSAQRATTLAARHACDVESMEGFAVLRAATVMGIPAIEIRGISNFVGDRADAQWDIAAGIRATIGALEALLDRCTSHEGPR